MGKAKGLSLKMVRRNCLDCSGGGAKHVTWCPCDGLHSTRCEFWPFRFGQGVEKVRRRYGPQLATPELMPDTAANLDGLPAFPPKVRSEGAVAG
jgi:hypothetical protein